MIATLDVSPLYFSLCDAFLEDLRLTVGEFCAHGGR